MYHQLTISYYLRLFFYSTYTLLRVPLICTLIQILPSAVLRFADIYWNIACTPFSGLFWGDSDLSETGDTHNLFASLLLNKWAGGYRTDAKNPFLYSLILFSLPLSFFVRLLSWCCLGVNNGEERCRPIVLCVICQWTGQRCLGWHELTYLYSPSSPATILRFIWTTVFTPNVVIISSWISLCSFRTP